MHLQNIFHLTGDFPDPIDSFKTQVIEHIVDLTSVGFDHTVFSINRMSPTPSAFAKHVASHKRMRIRAVPFDYGKAVSYEAPAKGVFHKARLIALGDWLAAEIDRLPNKPQLLIGHKLTIEGIAVERAAKKLKIPFAITIQSHTDYKILRMRPDLQGDLSRIYHDAKVVFAFAPIAKANLEKKLGRRSGPTRVIPCPTDLDTPLRPQVSKNSLLSVFHLKNFKTKNLGGMVKGLDLANERGASLTLDLVGGGEPADFTACRKIIGKESAVRLAGSLDRNSVRNKMNGAKVLVMPSISESFGLVFIEALFAGVPIIYPEGRAIDGFFDNHEFAIRVDPRRPRAIADAMIWACENEKMLKQSLSAWQESEDAKRFARPKISESYSMAFRKACMKLDQL